MKLKITLLVLLLISITIKPQYIQQIFIPQAYAGIGQPQPIALNDGKKFIEDLINKGLSILNKSNSTNKEFADLLADNFAVDEIAKIVLGRIKLLPDQKSKFIEYYKQIIINVYASPDKIKKFKGMEYSIKNVREDQRNTLIVATEFQKDSASPVTKVDWKIFSLNDKIWVLDVKIENLSQIFVDRDTYNNLFAQSNNDPDIFLKKVKEIAYQNSNK